jgi:hypothetical protein
MKLTKKQKAIKAKILAGTHVLKTDGESHDKAEKIIESISKFTRYCIDEEHYGVDFHGNFIYLRIHEIEDRPIINMSEWFEESEEPSESTKGMREYDEKLLTKFVAYYQQYHHWSEFGKAKSQFLNNRYPKEALLKEKSELEARLKEIEEQLGSEG